MDQQLLIAVAMLLASAGTPPGSASSLDGSPAFLERALLARALAPPPGYGPLLAEADAVAAEAGGDDGPVVRPEPPERGRINVTHGSYRNRYALDERRFGVAVQPGYAMIQGGDVVHSAFNDGPSITVRLIADLNPAASFYLDFTGSFHTMKDPRPMLFRTAYTSTSGYSGQMTILAPALYYSYTFPFGADFHRRAFLIPKIYLGLGPLYTIASGEITNAGSKGTVSGSGTQPFFQFTPGFGIDYRLPIFDEFEFVGFDLRYRLTLPTARPNYANEFVIPTVYVFEPALNVAWMFY